jgi:hypothetical protein
MIGLSNAHLIMGQVSKWLKHFDSHLVLVMQSIAVQTTLSGIQRGGFQMPVIQMD